MPTLLLTRPEDGSRRFARAMRDRLGHLPTVIAPLIGIELLPPPDVAQDDSYVLTSAQAVAAILAHDLPRRPAWAVGQATADAARKAALPVTVAGGDADALVADMVAAGAKGPFLHLHGLHTRGDVAARLTAAGIPARGAPVYDQPALPLPRDLADLSGGVVVPLCSPRTARIFAQEWLGSAPLFVAAMSDAVAAALGDVRCLACVIAERPDAEAMAATTESLWRMAMRLEAGTGAP